jgi:hypothetical protein
MEQHDLGELRPERFGYQPAKGYVRALCLLCFLAIGGSSRELATVLRFVLTRVQIK